MFLTKIGLALFFLLTCLAALAQQTVYQHYKVDSMAEPRGGMEK